MTEQALPFEQSIQRLQEIVDRLQRDDVPWRTAIALFKEGTELTTHCDSLLTSAELRVQQLTNAVHERFSSYQAEGSYSGLEPEEPPF